MTTRTINGMTWIQVTDRVWTPPGKPMKFAISHETSNGFTLWDYRNGTPASGKWFKTFAEAVKASKT